MSEKKPTPAATGFSIEITEDGLMRVKARNYQDDDHMWSIRPRPISLAKVREIAKIIGPDAVEALERRVALTHLHLDQSIRTAEGTIRRAQEARAALIASGQDKDGLDT